MFEIYNVAIVPLIIGIVQLLKRYGFPAKYSPLAAIFMGLALGIFFVTPNLKEGIIIGLMLGLSASGLYSGGKNLMENNNKNKDVK
ncbi:hypothetical protein D4T97_009970 [Siminovitchia acidinfaciens]|uniref:Holin n=1 Tax=Siminovitchia acidinfaciens TaxID=2321395 RepID=A0A429Y2V8_9BACI|nr:hypothetical protein [Siminovitchia acidinfaciens]RST75550.1 hypothetical protein D4T97_009970 [Siminovitchia acidinfaciens]